MVLNASSRLPVIEITSRSRCDRGRGIEIAVDRDHGRRRQAAGRPVRAGPRAAHLAGPDRQLPHVHRPVEDAHVRVAHAGADRARVAEGRRVPVRHEQLPARHAVAVVVRAAHGQRPAPGLRRHVDAGSARQVHLQLGDGQRLRVQLADHDDAHPGGREALPRLAAVDGEGLVPVDRPVPQRRPEEPGRERRRVVEVEGNVLEAVARAEGEVEHAAPAAAADPVLHVEGYRATGQRELPLDDGRRRDGECDGRRLAGVEEGDGERGGDVLVAGAEHVGAVGEARHRGDADDGEDPGHPREADVLDGGGRRRDDVGGVGEDGGVVHGHGVAGRVVGVAHARRPGVEVARVGPPAVLHGDADARGRIRRAVVDVEQVGGRVRDPDGEGRRAGGGGGAARDHVGPVEGVELSRPGGYALRAGGRCAVGVHEDDVGVLQPAEPVLAGRVEVAVAVVARQLVAVIDVPSRRHPAEPLDLRGIVRDTIYSRFGGQTMAHSIIVSDFVFKNCSVSRIKRPCETDANYAEPCPVDRWWETNKGKNHSIVLADNSSFFSAAGAPAIDIT